MEKISIYDIIYPKYKIKNEIRLIELFAGSGSTLRACAELNRSCYGFEIKKKYYRLAKEKMLSNVNLTLEI